MKRKLVPASEIRNETRVENSRFITTLSPAFSTEEARAFITRIKAEFADASHNVPAFIIGHAPSMISHTSDDGEPSGTAGRPALAVLKGSGLGDVVLVVTRYFGGTKLGKGGLVRAYGDAVRSILEITPLAQKAPTHIVMLVTPYPLYERVRLLVDSHQGEILDESFMVDVTLTCRFLMNQYPHFNNGLEELSHGKIRAEIIESNENSIFPVNSQ